MTTFLLIHGKWHDAACWDALAVRIRSAGHRVEAPDLPFHDPDTTYAERARVALDSVTDAEEPLVVVGHSLGAAYAPLVVTARPGAELVYLCPAPVGPFDDAGAPVPETREGFEFPRNREDGTSVWDPDVAIATIYPRLPPEAARAAARRLQPGASPKDAYPVEAQPDAPTTLIYARHDEFFNPAWADWVARNVAGVEPIALETGHFPMIEAPDALAGVLLTRG